ncbi:2,3-bisphosphoglycerate-dependent phosphoglycerate mutase [compost metagenome]
MAKQLIIVRHAKSDWGDFNLKDFDRPLNHRGHKNAPEMAERFVAKDIKPDTIVSSPALRALTTAKYFASGWKLEADQLNTNAAIYEASIKTLLKVINEFDDKFTSIALFGHNPGLTDLVNYLTDEYITNMPTCSVAIIEFPFDEWKLISGNTGNLVLFDYPKSGLD